MNISYLYIENYNQITNFQINFSNRYNIYLDESENKLSVSLNKKFMENFFEIHQKNIRNVSLLIGNNGTGKSSILNLIKEIYRGGMDSKSKKNIIGIMKNSDHLTLYINSERLEKLEFHSENFIEKTDEKYVYILQSKDSNDNNKLLIEFIPYNNSEDYNIILKNKNYVIKDTVLNEIEDESAGLVYYSNQFEDKINFYKQDNIIKNHGLNNIYFDLSLNNRLFSSSENISAESLDITYGKFKALDNIRRIDFLNDKKNIEILKEFLIFPEYFFLVTNKHPNDEINKFLEKIYFDELNEDFSKVTAVHNLIKGIIGSIIYEIINYKHYGVSIKLSVFEDYFVDKFDQIKIYINDLEKIQKDFEGLLKKELGEAFTYVFGRIDKLLNPYWEVVYLIKDRLLSKSKFNINYETNDNVSSFIKIKSNKQGLNFIKQINDIILKNTKIQSTFEFNWHDLSQGESNLFSLLSDLNTFIPEISRESVILLIDEGDLTLHPEWQRNYIYLLLTYLQIKFSNKKFQLILTTHSPIIISDLPGYCVNVLDDLKNSNKQDYNFKNYKETFALNIHEIYKHGQYLSSTTGRFAEEKINSLINFSNNGIDSLEDFNYALSLINLIGDNFVKKQLQIQVENSIKNYLSKRNNENKNKFHFLNRLKENVQKEIDNLEGSFDKNDYDKLQ